MQAEDWDDYTVSGLFDREDYPTRGDEWDETEGDATALTDREAYWCDFECDPDSDSCCDIQLETYRQPTVWEILKRQGIRAAINYKCERLCVGAFADMHRDAERRGYTLARPGYKMPWWFKWASRLEWYTRPKKKQKGT